MRVRDFAVLDLIGRALAAVLVAGVAAILNFRAPAAWKETCVPIPHSIAEGNIFPSLGSVSDSDRVI
jgi:hypothetical protein